MKDKLIDYFKLIRIKHYIKNILIFVPLFFCGLYTDINKVLICLVGFLTFSFSASIVYVLNDINDKEKDKLHETKKNRPIASGRVSLKEGYILIAILILLVILLSYILINMKANAYALPLILLYIFLNILYSKKLKNVVLIDVVILVLGFLIRLFFGALLINTYVSNWLYLTVMAGAFYMGFGKRRNEIIKSKNDTREVLKYYNKQFLDKSMYVCLALTIVFYSMWTVDENVLLKAHAEYLIWTVPLVMIILFQYSLAVEKDSFGDPVEVILNDKSMIVTIIIYILILLIIWL